MNQTIAQVVIKGKVRGLSSMAVCLEDAVGDQEREAAIANAEVQLERIYQALSDGAPPRDRLPLLFVRVKDVDMLERLAGFFVRFSPVLTGVILPKVSRDTLPRAMGLVDGIARQAKDPFTPCRSWSRTS